MIPIQNKNKGNPAKLGGRVTNAGDIIVKRLTSSSSINANVGGTAITVASVSSNSAVSTTEFASFAARYQEFRVVEMRFTFLPFHPTCDTAVSAHGSFLLGDYIGGNVPATASQLLSDESVMRSSTFKRTEYVLTWKGFPNGKLWNSTAGTIPTANQMAIAYGTGPVGFTTTASTPIFEVLKEFVVEFRGSQ